MSDEKISMEILSKIVIQLKTTQTESIKSFKEEINNLKTEHAKCYNELRERFETENFKLQAEILETKLKSQEKERVLTNEIMNVRAKFDKDVVDLREDLLKLLNKYESKFINQDDEIDALKKKCELSECNVCKYQSFKVHFFDCPDCKSIVCSNCLQVCKSCKATSCTGCLKKCGICGHLECIKCMKECNVCGKYNSRECFDNCYMCGVNECKNCLISCRKCEKSFCSKCGTKCVKCNMSISCLNCFEKDNTNEKCICGKIYCFNCEDECEECSVPCSWENNSRVFQGFHIKSASNIPNKCLLKFLVVAKGIETTHLGLTTDSEFKFKDSPTENFWSLCLNTGEKFSTSDYRKKGISWTKYTLPVKVGDYVYIRYLDGEVRFLINRKMQGVAFILEKKEKYFIYCLTHNDSTQIEIKGMKIIK